MSSNTERLDPPHAGTEADTLTAFLESQRDTLRYRTEGLDAGQLRRRLEPSAITLGGLLKHLAYVEDWWLNQVFAGNPEPEPWASVDWRGDPDWEWRSAAGDSPEELRELFEQSLAVSDRILYEALTVPEGLEAASRLERRRLPKAEFSLRWILVHLIEEYARHNGHADLVRESIDGQVGE